MQPGFIRSCIDSDSHGGHAPHRTLEEKGHCAPGVCTQSTSRDLAEWIHRSLSHRNHFAALVCRQLHQQPHTRPQSRSKHELSVVLGSLSRCLRCSGRKSFRPISPVPLHFWHSRPHQPVTIAAEEWHTVGRCPESDCAVRAPLLHPLVQTRRPVRESDDCDTHNQRV